MLRLTTLSAGINGIATNFLEVIKTRIISDSIRCDPLHYSKKTIFRHFESKPQTQILAISHCDNNCLPSRNAFEVAHHIYKTEGMQAFFRGATGQSLQQIIRAGSFFPFYHKCLDYFKTNVTTNSYYLPLLSSATARFFSVCLTFGIEKHTTELQATKITDKVNHSKVSSRVGFTSLAARDIFYSAIMWTVLENIRLEFKEREIFTDDISLTVSSSMVAGTIAAVFTYPFDLVKTLRIAHHDEFKNVDSVTMLRNVYRERGMKALTAGIFFRVKDFRRDSKSFKTVLGNFCVFRVL